MRHDASGVSRVPLIAVADDDPIIRAVLVRVLRGLGDARVHDFGGGDALLSWLEHHSPDLVITDHHMGDLSGTDVIRILRAMPRHTDVPILMVTSLNDRAIRHAALKAGASDFLTKPIDAEEVLLRSRNMLAVGASRRVLAQQAVDLQREVAKATALLEAREREIVLRLSRAAEQRDEETGLHVQRIAEFSRLIARELSLPAEEQQQLWLAAPMHDVGKIGVSDAILRKPGRFTPGERRLMEQHVIIGHNLLSGSGIPLLDTAASIALRHHERWDGTGYPDGLAGEAIPLLARIVAVADVYDALTSDRPYKSAWSHAAAVEFIREGADTQFDPAVVAAFVSALPFITITARRLRERTSLDAADQVVSSEHPAVAQS